VLIHHTPDGWLRLTRSRAILAHRIAFHLDFVGVVHQPVEDAVSRIPTLATLGLPA
jgi:hypothetical protein